MEIFSKNYKTSSFSLFFLFDNHEGNINHNRKAWLTAINYIKQTKQKRPVMTVLGGDMADCINTKDPRFAPTEISKKYSINDLKDLPQKQMQVVVDDLRPIQDTIECALYGNHEEAFIKHSGTDIFSLMETKLKFKRLGYEGVICLELDHEGDKLPLKIVVSHGTGGGGFLPGYALNTCMKLFEKWVDCDYHIMGHIHKLEARAFDYLTIKDNKLNYVTKWFGVGGTFLETYKEGTRNYFESKKGMLADTGFLELKAIYKGGWNHKLVSHKMQR